MKLENSKVYRCGVTSPYISYETNDIKIDKREDYVRIYFELSSKGGGYTAVHAQIGKQDFAKVLKIMSDTDRQAAMQAMVSEMGRLVEGTPQILAAEKKGRTTPII